MQTKLFIVHVPKTQTILRVYLCLEHCVCTYVYVHQ